MKISELIKELKKIKNKEGDLEVKSYGDYCTFNVEKQDINVKGEKVYIG